MNEQWFDDFTQQLTTGLPRRETIALLAGAFATMLSGGDRTVEAGCKKVNKKCDKNKDCCDGAKCKKDKCKCKSGRQKCGGKCYQLDRDKQHCGSCNTQCLDNDFCQDGRCINVPS